MNTWRSLRFESNNAFANMAIDEAVMIARAGNLIPNTIRFYGWKPSAVSVGRFQDALKEVHIETCRNHGLDVVRRISGGGTVFHDERGEITYSVVVSQDDLGVRDIAAAYSRIYAGLAEGLRILGVKADFSQGTERACPNLTVKGRKISGSAQSHKKGIVLQHGTLLVDVDLIRMFTYLRVPWAETCMDVAKIAENRITSIRKELGKEVSIKEVIAALIEGFQEALDMKLVESELTVSERQIVEELGAKKYGTEEWNLFGKSPMN